VSFSHVLQTLGNRYEVSVESSSTLISSVQNRISRRRSATSQSGASTSLKSPAVHQPLRGNRRFSLRAIDLLRKIGEMTTPYGINDFELSSSWATLRYFWAINSSANRGGRVQRLYLSDDARYSDFHQKGLLSDEFGLGFAGLVAERVLGTTAICDVSAALDDPGNFQDISRQGRKEPDYLMWNDNDPSSPLYVIESKGTQSNRSTSIGQLADGLAQVPSLSFSLGPRTIISLVVATYLKQRSTSVFVVDPTDDSKNLGKKEEGSNKATKRVKETEWQILDWPRFNRRVWTAHELQLLRWVDQHETANSLAESMDIKSAERSYQVSNARLERRKTSFGEYDGSAAQYGPSFNGHSLMVFRGIRHELLAQISESRHDNAREFSSQIRSTPETDLPAGWSFGPAGTCLIVDVE
jgi:hypothetical protein